MINLSSSAPPAPAGGTNVTWQQDSSGNVSAYVSTVKKTVTAVSGVLTIDASTGSSFLIPISAAITTVNITNPTDGQEITLLWQQGSTPYAVTLPSNMRGAVAVAATANKSTTHKLTYNAGDTNWYAFGGFSGI